MIQWTERGLATKDLTPRRAVAECERGDWLLWLARRFGYGRAKLEAAVRPSVLRALRVHAPAALDRAGLPVHAGVLRDLPDNIDRNTARAVLRAALDASQALARLTMWIPAAKASEREQAALRAARAVRAADQAWEMDIAPEAAAWAAGAAWESADSRSAGVAEHARCADEVRAALPDLAERFDKAVRCAVRP